MSTRETIRIASGQGFWGDRLDAPVDQVRRGPIDFLVLDYLAEVTMSILQKQRSRDPTHGYARDFVPLMGEVLPDCVERRVRVIANAGGVNLEACRDGVLTEARRVRLAGQVRVGVVAGDDLIADFIGETNFLEGRIEAADGPALRLACGTAIAMADGGARAGEAVSVAIRPERSQIQPAGDAAGLAGTIETVVYFGTDTIFHLRLKGGEPFKVRVQNADGARRRFAHGDAVAVRVAPDAVQILAD